MKTPTWWYTNSSILGTALAPLGALYGSLSGAVRKTPRATSIPVLCVGNIVAGGGGKTPVALAVGQWCKANNIHAFFVSRGYGGAHKEPVQVSAEHTAEEVGDEPLLLARCLPTVIGKNRLGAIEYAAARGATLAILDDGLQNTTIQKTRSLLVLKGENPLGNGRLIPAGPLREPLEQGLARADAVIWIDPPPACSLPTPHPCFTAKSRLALPGAMRSVAAFAGIARPEFFKQALEAAGASVVSFTGFADHHVFSTQELDRLVSAAERHSVPLVTTEKDWVRLPAGVQDKITPLPLTLTFDDSAAFEQWLNAHLLPSHRQTMRA